MTEAEWLACTDPEKMLRFLGGKVSGRKLRLFACACCRRIWHWMPDEQTRKAVEVAERYADGRASEQALSAARNAASIASADSRIAIVGESLSKCQAVYFAARTAENATEGGAHAAAARAALTLLSSAVGAAGDPATRIAGRRAAADDIHQFRKRLFNDIFGPLPFRPVTIDPAWLRWNFGTVPAIARHVYEDRAFHDMPILADALEDAGCTNADILTHSRQSGEHVRGCWVVDLLLGKR
jgi:hypothetical protein